MNHARFAKERGKSGGEPSFTPHCSIADAMFRLISLAEDASLLVLLLTHCVQIREIRENLANYGIIGLGEVPYCIL